MHRMAATRRKYPAPDVHSSDLEKPWSSFMTLRSPFFHSQRQNVISSMWFGQNGVLSEGSVIAGGALCQETQMALCPIKSDEMNVAEETLTP